MKLPITGSRHFANFLMVGESEEGLFAKGMSPCRGARTHNHQITAGGECLTDWATAALLFISVKSHQVIWNTCGLKKVASAASFIHDFGGTYVDYIP